MIQHSLRLCGPALSAALASRAYRFSVGAILQAAGCGAVGRARIDSDARRACLASVGIETCHHNRQATCYLADASTLIVQTDGISETVPGEGRYTVLPTLDDPLHQAFRSWPAEQWPARSLNWRRSRAVPVAHKRSTRPSRLCDDCLLLGILRITPTYLLTHCAMPGTLLRIA